MSNTGDFAEDYGLEDYTADQAQYNTTEATEADNKGLKKGYAGTATSGFRDFLLRAELQKAIAECGFEHPSSVQHEAIPVALLGKDVLVQAKSGMGKTAVFVLAVLQRIDISSQGEPSCLVLCHTRELAHQICKEFLRFSKYLRVKTAVFYGGVALKQNEDTLKNELPNVIVGTPGRILQLAQQGTLKLNKIKFFVLDECDKLLETLDMRKSVQDIYKFTPHNKQVMMLSATFSDEVKAVCKKFMRDPEEIIDDGGKLTLHGLVQHFVKLDEKTKLGKLNEILDKLEFNQVVIFVKGVKRAEELNKILEKGQFPTTYITSTLQQEERIKRYEMFKSYDKRVLVSTDLMARGVDIERVNVVINFDMSESADTYLHRVGRAGRFGTKGLAISFISTPEDEAVLKSVQDKFVVKITDLPDKIDASTYTSA